MHNTGLHCDVAIIGGGFAGLSALLKLRKRLGSQITIKLFDKNEQFLYVPGLHEAVLAPESKLTTMQFKYADYYPNEFVQGEVARAGAGSITLADGTVRTCTHTVVSPGSVALLPPGGEDSSITHAVRTAADIPRLNTALRTSKSVIIIGGGYTGVEVAAIIAAKRKHTPAGQSITLVHSRDRVTDTMSERVSERAQHRLRDHGVTLVLGQRVHQIDDTSITLADGTTLEADCVIICAGNTFKKGLIEQTADPHVHLCGDVEHNGLEATAHNAMIEGRRVGDQIADQIVGIHDTEYPPLFSRTALAMALGPYDGIITDGPHGFYLPRFVGFSKWIIEKRVLGEFKWKVMFWI